MRLDLGGLSTFVVIMDFFTGEDFFAGLAMALAFLCFAGEVTVDFAALADFFNGDF